MKKTVAVLGTMDTKGAEYFFLKEQLEKNGVDVLMIDTGIVSQSRFPCQIAAEEVAGAGGGALEDIPGRDRSFAFTLMGNGSAAILRGLYLEGKIQGAISMGGGQGTLLAAMALGDLPSGFPKMIVSTVANLRLPPFEGVKDTIVMNPLVDVSGLNRILRQMLCNAAAAMAGMVLFSGFGGSEAQAGGKTVAMTMFGVTTPCVSRARDILEEHGYEVIVFHANGMGGKRMEEMIREGAIGAVADITTGELAQEYLGGNCSAGPHRLEAAPQMGIAQVVVPGALDLANFMPPSALPSKYKGRRCYMHNPNLKLLRADAQESREIALILAKKLNRSRGPVTVLLPKRGVSQYSCPGGPLEDREADQVLFETLKEMLRSDFHLIESESHINDPEFGELVAHELMKIY